MDYGIRNINYVHFNNLVMLDEFFGISAEFVMFKKDLSSFVSEHITDDLMGFGISKEERIFLKDKENILNNIQNYLKDDQECFIFGEDVNKGNKFSKESFYFRFQNINMRVLTDDEVDFFSVMEKIMVNFIYGIFFNLFIEITSTQIEIRKNIIEKRKKELEKELFKNDLHKQELINEIINQI